MELRPVGSHASLLQLGPLAQAVFATRPPSRIPTQPIRPSAWMERKVEREALRPELSHLAVDPDHPNTQVGLILVGYDASTSTSTAWIALLGVIPPWRGRGIGSRLLHAAYESCVSRQIGEIEVLAESQAQGFYAQLGARSLGPVTTAVSSGHGERPGALLDVTSTPKQLAPLVHEIWPPGSWRRTRAKILRRYALADSASAYIEVGVESGYTVVLRVCGVDPAEQVALIAAARDACPRGRPFIVAHWPQERIGELPGGFRAAQHGVRMCFDDKPSRDAHG